MEPIGADVTAQTTPAGPHRELSPSAALTRFEPPAGFVPVATATITRRVRYGFRAGGLGFLIGSGVGSEVVPMMPVATIPNGPSWLLGVINLRGNLVPVCDLGTLLGPASAEAAAAKPMILVLDKGDKAVGFIISGVPVALTALKQLSQVPGLPELLAGHVPAAHTTADDIWLEFDHEGFLLATG